MTTYGVDYAVDTTDAGLIRYDGRRLHVAPPRPGRRTVATMDTTTTPDADLPEVAGDITNTLDGRILVGGQQLAPGRYRYAGTNMVLEVADIGGESDEETAARIARDGDD